MSRNAIVDRERPSGQQLLTHLQLIKDQSGRGRYGSSGLTFHVNATTAVKSRLTRGAAARPGRVSWCATAAASLGALQAGGRISRCTWQRGAVSPAPSSAFTSRDTRAILQAVATFRGWRGEMRLDDAVAALAVPTLFVWGENDQLAPADVARALTQRMPDAKVAVISDAGHIPHIDQPDAVAAAINGFLHQLASQ